MTRKWVRKERISSTSNRDEGKKTEQEPCVPLATDARQGHTPCKSNADVVGTPVCTTNVSTDNLSDSSATPLSTFKNLKRVDEVD